MAPFSSEKQRRYMWAKHPKIARRWADEEKEGGSLIKSMLHKRNKKRGK